MSDKQTCEKIIEEQLKPWKAFYRTDFPGGDDLFSLIMLFMAKRIDEQQRTIEELTKKVEMLSKIAGVG